MQRMTELLKFAFVRSSRLCLIWPFWEALLIKYGGFRLSLLREEWIIWSFFRALSFLKALSRH